MMTYPRKRFVRWSINTVGRLLFMMFSRTQVNGRANIPRSGGAIFAANHVDTMDIALMAVLSGRGVEVLGGDDVPFPPIYQAVIDFYGYISLKRGRVDRTALSQAIEVLKAGQVVGIFPEGSVWESNSFQFRQGVAWLSLKTGAPVIPMGFGGTRGAVPRVFRLERPRFVMNIGAPIYPARDADLDARARKQHLDALTQKIGEQIIALIPPEDRVTVQPESLLVLVDDVMVYESLLLGKVFFQTRILQTFSANLRLDVAALLTWDQPQETGRVLAAVRSILDYCRENPTFLEYRLGKQEAQAVIEALTDLTYRMASASMLVLTRSMVTAAPLPTNFAAR